MVAVSDQKIDPGVVINQLWQSVKPGAKIYAVLDGARDGKIYEQVVKLDSQVYRSLFTGKLGKDLAAVAPYLVQLERDGDFTRMLIEQGWGKGWGIFLESSASLDELQKHFLGLLLAKDEVGRPLHFRFYDPRVLRIFLPTCTEEELKTILGAVVTRFRMQSKDAKGKNIVEFPPKKTNLIHFILQDDNDNPYANKKFEFWIDGEQYGDQEKRTTLEGVIKEEVPEGENLEIKVWLDENDEPEVYLLEVGGLDPIDTIEGIQDRLNNLGYDCGEEQGSIGLLTKEALKAFQIDVGLDPTGNINKVTEDKLLQEHRF